MIQILHPEHIRVAHQKKFTVHSSPWRIDPAQCCKFNSNHDSVEHLDVFPKLQNVENIADSESQPPPPALQWAETYRRAGAELCNYIAEPWEYDTQGSHETNLQNNPYYMFVTSEDYKYIQRGIKKKGMKTY